MTDNLPAYLESLNHTFNANEVARFLGIRRDTVYAYARAGELPSFNIGKTKTMLRFDPKVLAEWVRDRQSYIVRVSRSENPFDRPGISRPTRKGQLFADIEKSTYGEPVFADGDNE